MKKRSEKSVWIKTLITKRWNGLYKIYLYKMPNFRKIKNAKKNILEMWHFFQTFKYLQTFFSFLKMVTKFGDPKTVFTVLTSYSEKNISLPFYAYRGKKKSTTHWKLYEAFFKILHTRHLTFEFNYKVTIIILIFILVCSVIKFLDRNFLFIEKVFAFLESKI